MFVYCVVLFFWGGVVFGLCRLGGRREVTSPTGNPTIVLVRPPFPLDQPDDLFDA